VQCQPIGQCPSYLASRRLQLCQNLLCQYLNSCWCEVWMFPKAHLTTCPNDIRLGDGSTRHCTVFLLRGKYKASLFSITNLNRPLIHPLRSSELNNSGIDVRTQTEHVNASFICLTWSSASSPLSRAQHSKLRLRLRMNRPEVQCLQKLSSSSLLSLPLATLALW